MLGARPSPLAGAVPLTPRRKWRAITLATLLLTPAFWSVLIGMVAAASDDVNAPPPAPFVAFGLAIVPFVFVVLAFLSEHPRAAGAAVKAMAVGVLVGIPVSAAAGDAATGLVAGLGAGGIIALRSEVGLSWKARAIGVAVAAVYEFLLLRSIPGIGLLMGPALPFVSLGVADHIVEWRHDRRPSSG
jgi:hypothetical protein